MKENLIRMLVRSILAESSAACRAQTGSIYKDPKFARKHYTATRGKPKITKYEDEDEA
jgi:hypothetical protein